MIKYNWLYQIRGMAIIAVVVCHQQGLLHQTEWVQLLTLFSVTTLIFCAGLTQSMSLTKSKKLFINNEKYSFYEHILIRLKPIILAYVVVTIAYLTQIKMWTGIEFEVLAKMLLTFSASPPLYFLRIFIALTFVAPILYTIINRILNNNRLKIIIDIEIVIFLIITFVIGYLSIGKLDFLGQSYLFVYAAGMVFGSKPMPKVKNVQLPFIITIFAFGLWSTKQFYWARIAGDYGYAKGIDSFVSKLQMNPPNLSIIIYSVGCFLLFYWIFNKVELHKERISKFALVPFKILTLLGKYSLDIFLWHLFIQKILMFNLSVPNIWIKSMVFYSSMFFVPICFRIMYEKLKKYMYTEFRKTDNSIKTN